MPTTAPPSVDMNAAKAVSTLTFFSPLVAFELAERSAPPAQRLLDTLKLMHSRECDVTTGGLFSQSAVDGRLDRRPIRFCAMRLTRVIHADEN
jgi:hypothetical protein